MNALAIALPDVDVNSATFSFTGGSVVERLQKGQMVPWQGFIVVEDVDTGDGRRVSSGALSWNDDLLPIPLMAQFENPVGGSGHDGAVLAGKIMTMTRVGSKVWATGYIDPFAPGGIRLALALDRQTMRGISVDLDSVELAEDRRSGVRNITKGRIRGATVCPFQAIVEASIELTNDEGDAMAASAGQMTARVFSTVDAVESLVASGGASIPLAPPKAWFALPSNPADRNHPLEITADGRLSGIIASEGTCHIAFANRCEPPPKSKTNYAAFRVGSVLTAEGDTVRTGPIVMDTVHPDLRRAASDAMAFYAHTGAAVADVVPYDTEFGIYIAGVMRPSATPEQIRNLRASDISPDWRFINGNPRECCALLAVNNGGFKVPQSLAASAGDYIMPGDTAVAVKGDEILALVASGGYKAAHGECTECQLAVKADEDDDTILEKDDDDELELAADFLVRFGPRQFRTPKVRVFRVEQFHASHDQSSHGNRAGRTGTAPVTGDTNQTGGYWEQINRTDNRAGRRSGVLDDSPKKAAKGSPRKGGTLSNGEKVAPLGNPKATKSGYDPDKGMRVDENGVPIVHWKTQRTKLQKNSWNLVRDDSSDLTDDNVYVPGAGPTGVPKAGPPRWVYIGPDGYPNRSMQEPADLEFFKPVSAQGMAKEWSDRQKRRASGGD